MLAEISQTSLDSKTGTQTTAKELAQERMTADLMHASWFKDAFSDLDLDKSKARDNQCRHQKHSSIWMGNSRS
jgi:hypothetical protein